MTNRVPAPELAETWAWLERAAHPAANLILRRHGHAVPWSAGAETDRRKLLEDAAIRDAFTKQQHDGSWGDSTGSEGRILPTLWVVKSLVDAGLDQETEEVYDAIGFLERTAKGSRRVFSTLNDDSGVLACYVGMAAQIFRDAGRPDLAAYQLQWLTTYQQVRVGGDDRRATEDWGNGLEHRYGGCFATTSCVLGIVRAAEAWREGGKPEHAEAFEVAKEALLERRIAFTRDHSALLPLPTGGTDPESWVRPAFPAGWRIDLLDALHALAGTVDRDDARAADALAIVMDARRPDGSWARGWHVTSAFLRGFGRAPVGEGNPIITARVAVTLDRWFAGAIDPDPLVA